MQSRKKDKPLTSSEKTIIAKLIAQTYMKGGQFGYKRGKDLIQQQLNYQIPAATYNNFLTTIVRMGFRELEEFLKTNTKMKIKSINHNQQQIIRTPLIQCRDWMNQAHVDTFLKFISHHYQIKTLSVTKKQAISLYEQLRTLLDNYQQKEAIMQQKRKAKQIAERSQQTQNNHLFQNQKAQPRDDPDYHQRLLSQIASQYLFYPSEKQKDVKEEKIDYDKFQGDLGVTTKKQSK